jgi:hypothetical protein
MPLVVRLDRGGVRVLVLGQALHRFLQDRPHDVRDLVVWAAAPPIPALTIALAGTDWEDERATGALIGEIRADVRVIADLTGPIRRRLGLPTRPLSAALAAAPVGTLALECGSVISRWERTSSPNSEPGEPEQP